MKTIKFNIKKGYIISWGTFKMLIGFSSKKKSKVKEENSNKFDCICEENNNDKQISGWCSKHNTDWL